MITLLHGDCLEVMPTLPKNSAQMFFCDLPYSQTNNRWDIDIPLAKLWECISRLMCESGIVACTATMKFSVQLISSNVKWFRHDLVWDKTRSSGFANANRSPLRSHEHILLFASGRYTYNAQKTNNSQVKTSRTVGKSSTNWTIKPISKSSDSTRFPLSILSIKRDDMRNKCGHPTQKPVALLEWLIKTYTNSGDTVLDPTMGSGTTGVACINTGRNFIGIEKDAAYFDAASARIEKFRAQSELDFSVSA